MSTAYLDASAIVKLFKPERESGRLAEVLAGYDLWTSSEVVTVEAACTARRLGDAQMVGAAESVLSSVALMPLTPRVRLRAAAPFGCRLRALDAIHAASALQIADDLAVVVAYDADLAGALEGEGLSVVAPGA